MIPTSRDVDDAVRQVVGAVEPEIVVTSWALVVTGVGADPGQGVYYYLSSEQLPAHHLLGMLEMFRMHAIQSH